MSEETNQLIAQRRQALQELRRRNIDPYPYSFDPTHRAADLHREYGDYTAILGEPRVRIAGRIMTRRIHGGSSFAHLQDETGRIQIYLRRNVLGQEDYETFRRLLDIGDILGVEGKVFRTRTGELTVEVESYQLLAKALRPLPEKWHGLTDVETRYRQRYLDLIVNPHVREVFRKRTLIVQTIREFLNRRGYLEVETPILQPLYGGANARPFTTHHHALDATFYLRISNELYLKRLIVGGFERVYEFSRDFRNEGIDRFHNPEFTLMECYEAYADYERMMDLTEEMLEQVALAVHGTTEVEFQGQKLNFARPWRRISMVEAIRQTTGIDVLAQDVAGLRKLLLERGLPEEDLETEWGSLVAQLFEETVEKTLVQPTIVYDYPLEVSPLAKKKRGDQRFVERFEPYVAGMEIGNAFSELNDPDDQRKRFEAQMARRRAGDEEAQPLDEDYLRALEYGMPPTGGLGIGIDRLVMVMTDMPSIRDVILFPQLRPES
ncbi:MAG: lysine--tRNA ligase [Candidatus Poribacteria bacterium]|nr:MAG: lysine--tRNA ligase [Candidatus Poribacteria bacterium]